MAIVYVGERASNKTTAGAGTTQAVTVVGAATAGSTIILCFASRDTSAAGCSVADTQGNTWTIDVGPFNGSNKFGFIASTRQNVAPLANGNTVTVTFGTAPGASRAWMLEEFSGLLTSAGYVDQTAQNNNAAATSGDSGTTGTTSQASELAVAMFSIDGNATATHDASYTDFTAAFLQNANGANAAELGAQYKILAATGTQVASWTGFTAASSYQGMIATYKAAAAGAVTVPALALMGVGT